MRVQVSQNSRSRWVAFLQSDYGDTQEVADGEFETRDLAVGFAEGRWPDVPIVADGLNYGSDAPPAPLPKVDPAAELLGMAGSPTISGPAERVQP